MWYELSTLSGKHYAFKKAGFNTRYIDTPKYKSVFQVFVKDLEDLQRLKTIFSCDVIITRSVNTGLEEIRMLDVKKYYMDWDL